MIFFFSDCILLLFSTKGKALSEGRRGIERRTDRRKDIQTDRNAHRDESKTRTQIKTDREREMKQIRAHRGNSLEGRREERGEKKQSEGTRGKDGHRQRETKTGRQIKPNAYVY